MMYWTGAALPLSPLLLLVLFFPQASSLDQLVRNLKRFYPDWEPQGIVDVGANRGRWSTAARGHYPNARLLLLEATPQHDTTLSGVVQQLGNAEHQIQVLSHTTGDTVDWFEGGDTTGNSMFREQTKFYKDAKANKRITITLDDAIQKSHLKKNQQNTTVVDLIKLDVQGAELLVLQGALHTLEEATFVQLEYSLIEYNTGGAACIYEVDEFFRTHGFYLYDIDELQRNGFLFNTSGVGQMDAMYVKPTSNRLPTTWANCTYCGMTKRKTTTRKEQQKEQPIQAVEAAIPCALQNVIGQSLNGFSNKHHLVFGFVCFCIGICVGRWTKHEHAPSGHKQKQRLNNRRKHNVENGTWFQQRTEA